MPLRKSNWNFLQQAHRQKLIREEDVDSGNYQGGLSTQKRTDKEKDKERENDDTRHDEDFAVLSDLSSEEDTPRIKVPLSKDEALAAVQRSKVLKGLSIHGQVRVAALLRRACYQPGERLWSAQEGEVQEKRLVVIERGEAELWLPEADGERFVGLSGPTKVLGGLFAVGSASRQVFSARVPEGDDAKPLHAWEIESSDLEQFESLFNAVDLAALRRRVLQDVRIQLMPYLQRQLAAGGVFSRYSSQFIGQLVKDMDLRLFEPGQVIFKEKSLGRSIGILVSGCVDIIANGRKVMSKSDSGQEIGEAALFESAYRRHATTRCSQSCETLMFLASRDAFYACLAKFPEEKIKLSVQVRHRISMTVMKEPFNMCDPAFLHLVCTECEVVHLTWPKTATSPEQDEVMHLCYTGDLVVEEENSEVPSRFAKKWEIFGLQAALGLRNGPPEYKLMAGRQGCTLVRVTWAAVEQALLFFPNQLPRLLRMAGYTEVPHDHPFRGRETLVWDIIQPLMCRVFCNLDIDHEFCQVLAPHFKASVYDAGCLIAPEAGPSRSVLLLVSGEICWSRQGIVTYVATAPDYFDEACLFSERGHCANITAKSTAVIWRLHVNALHLPADSHYAGMARRLLMEVEELTEDIQSNLRSNMRNMKTWRRFNSEVLGLLSDNIFLRTYLPGQCIFSDGDVGEFIYILMRGRVEVQSQGKSSFLEEGVTFGEMVLFGQAHRSTTITACCLCIINAVHKDLVSYALRMQPRKTFVVDNPPRPSPHGRVKGTEDKAVQRPARPQREIINQYAEWQAIENAQRRGFNAAVPRRLQQRLERSFLLQGHTPRLPPVESRLYKVPKVTEMKLRTAFDHVIPRHVIVASSDMLGIREGYVHKVKQLGLDDSLSSFRLPRATYTEPIQRRMAAQRNAKRKAPGSDAPAERPQTLTVLGDLQALAASLLRLSSKPSISHLLATDPRAPTMPLPSKPPRRLPRLSGYSRSLAQSARAYTGDGRSSRGERSISEDVAEETETPSPVILNYDVSPVGSSSDQTNEDQQPDEEPAAPRTDFEELKAAAWCARRLAYESYEAQMQRAQWLAILLSSSEESEALLQLDVYLEDGGLDGVSSAGTVQSVSVVESVTFTPDQVSPSSSRVHSISAEDVVSYLVDLQ
eukprot:s34_g24.t2